MATLAEIEAAAAEALSKRPPAEAQATQKDGVPTFGSLMAEQELQEELPEALQTLQTSVYYAFSSMAAEQGQDPRALLTQSLSEFQAWALALVDEVFGTTGD